MSLSSEIIFTFAGNIGRVQNVPFLLESVKKCDIENVHFLFIGGGAMVKEVELLSKNHNNISYAGSFGRDEQNNFLSACDIAIVSLSKGMAGLGVPSKTYNILASGKPILFLGEENTEIATMIKDNDIGWVIDQDNHLGFLNAIRMISQDPVNFKEKGVRSRELALKKYKKDLILNKYVDLFKAN